MLYESITLKQSFLYRKYALRVNLPKSYFRPKFEKVQLAPGGKPSTMVSAGGTRRAEIATKRVRGRAHSRARERIRARTYAHTHTGIHTHTYSYENTHIYKDAYEHASTQTRTHARTRTSSNERGKIKKRNIKLRNQCV